MHSVQSKGIGIQLLYSGPLVSHSMWWFLVSTENKNRFASLAVASERHKQHTIVSCGSDCIRVIPNQFSKSLQVTPSELDETWFVSSTCGFMKPDKTLLSYVVWLPDYSPSKIQLFPDFCWYSNCSNPHNFLILQINAVNIFCWGSIGIRR